MAYKLMTKLITNYKNGRRTYTKERLAEMTDVYYGAGRLTDSQYEELMAEIDALD